MINFDAFYIDENRFYNIKDKVVDIKLKLKNRSIDLKSSLIGHKDYFFIYDKQPIQDVFGLITDSVIFYFN